MISSRAISSAETTGIGVVVNTAVLTTTATSACRGLDNRKLISISLYDGVFIVAKGPRSNASCCFLATFIRNRAQERATSESFSGLLIICSQVQKSLISLLPLYSRCNRSVIPRQKLDSGASVRQSCRIATRPTDRHLHNEHSRRTHSGRDLFRLHMTLVLSQYGQY